MNLLEVKKNQKKYLINNQWKGKREILSFGMTMRENLRLRMNLNYMISDGDVLAAIETCFESTGIDMMLGIGGAPEGVLAACALKCLDGGFQAKLKPVDEEQKRRILEMGGDLNKVYDIDDLVKADEVVFAATGVSSGGLLNGVVYGPNNTAKTQTLVLRNESGTIRYIDAIHRLDKKPEYAKWKQKNILLKI